MPKNDWMDGTPIDAVPASYDKKAVLHFQVSMPENEAESEIGWMASFVIEGFARHRFNFENHMYLTMHHIGAVFDEADNFRENRLCYELEVLQAGYIFVAKFQWKELLEKLKKYFPAANVTDLVLIEKGKDDRNA